MVEIFLSAGKQGFCLWQSCGHFPSCNTRPILLPINFSALRVYCCSAAWHMLILLPRGWRNMDPVYRVGRGSARGSNIFFVTYCRKVLPISQIMLPKKLGSSDAQKTPDLQIYWPKIPQDPPTKSMPPLLHSAVCTGGVKLNKQIWKHNHILKCNAKGHIAAQQDVAVCMDSKDAREVAEMSVSCPVITRVKYRTSRHTSYAGILLSFPPGRNKHTSHPFRLHSQPFIEVLDVSNVYGYGGEVSSFVETPKM